MFIPFTIVVVTVVAMEAAAALIHRFVMHGFGWGWHRSHHEPHTGWFELNDLYAVLFAAISILLFALGSTHAELWWVGLGMVIYGIGYAILHDALVHGRVRFAKPPRRGYLKRLVQAHRLHHSVRTKEGAVSFGFLYAPPVTRLLSELRERRGR
jgi:beta-carotene 3-hydroxylase